MLSLIKKYCFVFITTLFLMSCGRNKTPAPDREIGNNVLYNRFQSDEKGNVFVVRENGVKFLEWNGIENLNLIELPFKEKTENISGNKDTLIINTNGKISIIVNNKGIVEEIGSIKGFANCDKFERKRGLLFSLTGNSECNFGSRNAAIKVFNISEPRSISEITSVRLSDPQDMVFDNNLIFIAEGKSGFKIFEKDQNGVLKVLSNVENFTANQLSLLTKKKILIIKSNSEVRQYDYSNSSNPKLLSIIVLTK
jgi:hypothetical protein